MAWIQSLAQELPCAMSVVIKKKKKKRSTRDFSHTSTGAQVWGPVEGEPKSFYFFGLFRVAPEAYGSFQAGH